MNKIIVQNHIISSSLKHMLKLTKIRTKLAPRQFLGGLLVEIQQILLLLIFVLVRSKFNLKTWARHVLKILHSTPYLYIYFIKMKLLTDT